MVSELDHWLCDWFDCNLIDGTDYSDTDTVLPMLHLCGITSTEQLEQCIRLNREPFIVYMKRRFPRISDDGNDGEGLYTKGSSVYLLAHPLALAAGGPQKLRDLLTTILEYSDNDDVIEQTIQEISNCAEGLEWKL